MNTKPEGTVTLTLSELEEIIRRVVREVVREELIRLLCARPRPGVDADSLEDLEHLDDDALLAQVLLLRRQRGEGLDWKGWERFRDELGYP